MEIRFLKQSVRHVVLVAVASFVMASTAQAIEFHKSLKEAANADKKNRPIVLCFGTESNELCRKMTSETFTDPRVEKIADQFVWVKVDIDKQKEFAAQYRVGDVPRTIVQDAKGIQLGDRRGYLPADEFVLFLNESLKNRNPEELVKTLSRRLAEATSKDEQRDLETQIAAALLRLVAAPITSPAQAIEFHRSIKEARDADKQNRPMVLSFGAGWCGWCRKMEFDTFIDPRVEQIGGQFVWVKVDIDKQQELAARFRVHGVPRTIVLDAKGRQLGDRSGYVPADKFVAFLSESLENPTPVELMPALLRRLNEAKSADEQRDAVTKLVERLAGPQRQQRQEILDAFAKQGSATWTVLADLMADKRLSIRAAAAGALKQSTAAELPFHPFGNDRLRTQQHAAWRTWIDRNSGKPRAEKEN